MKCQALLSRPANRVILKNMTVTGGESAPELPSASCRVRGVLDRIGDKWAIYVVDRLGGGPLPVQ